MDIKSFGCNVYLVSGCVIAVFDDTFDLHDEGSRTWLLELGRTSYTEPWDKAMYGGLTVRTASRIGDGPLGHGRALGSMHMSELPERAKEQLRKEFPEYASDV